MKKISSKIKGFTLVEVLTVIAIVSILSSIALASMSSARANARDKIRTADIAQLELALRLYVEQNGSTIDCQNGVFIDGDSSTLGGSSFSTGTCNDASDILTFLKSFMGSIPVDPKGPNNTDYYYYFDNNHNCEAGPPIVAAPLIFAVNLEKLPSNALEVCPIGTGNDGGYISISSNISTPYVRKPNFTTQGVTP